MNDKKILNTIQNKINQLLKEKENIVIAIDGMSNSGKTTLANQLTSIYDANLIHTDDFFLPHELRTSLRLSEPGGNIHYERFKKEIINNLSKNILYRPFSCKTLDYKEPIKLKLKRVTIIEGSYSLHPYFSKYYDLSIFLSISNEEQKERVCNRENKEKQVVFLSKWIPLENYYFKTYNIKEGANMKITTINGKEIIESLRIKIYPISSSLHDSILLEKETISLIEKLEKETGFTYEIATLDNFYDANLSLILVQSGGSENSFLALKDKFHEPYHLLTFGFNNSLAASIEILSYLKNNKLEGEILHGDTSYLANKINELIINNKPSSLNEVNLGVIGKPSDWLIASNVNYKEVKRLYNINLIDIPMEELLDLYNNTSIDEFKNNTLLEYNKTDLDKAKRLDVALSKLVNKYNLKGLTIRCFDLLGSIKTTGCLGLSLLNNEGIIGTCEGDIPSMISMYLIKSLVKAPSFQANPSRINTNTNEIIFAHCTIPTNMLNKFYLTSHYESKIGVAIKGELNTSPVTIFKLGANLKDYYCEEGLIECNLNEAELCRTQIKIKLNDVSYFLTNPLGNHHIIFYGKHKKEIQDFFFSNINN